MRFSVVAMAAILAASPTMAEMAPNIAACASKKDERERLACFDAATKGTSEDTTRDQDNTKTKDIIKPATGDYKVVAAEDLSIAPGKYDGKPIEMRKMRCFHADKDEYRCIGSGIGPALMIIAPLVSPEPAKAQIEDKCGELRKVLTSTLCQKTIRFTPAAHDSDTISGYQNRTIVVTREIEIVGAK
jgi:hypothetical protein